MVVQLAAGYEGTEPFPDAGGPPRSVGGAVRVAVTLAIVIVPFAGLGVAVSLAWGHGLRLADVLLATALYLVTGLGVTIGFQYYGEAGTAVWAPPVDISERKDAYLVTAELPGVKASDVEITVEDGLLTIQGERHFAHDSSEEKMHRTERFYGGFRRSITLPSHVEADKIEASAQDGVLQIMVPKAPEVQAKRIQVRVGRGHTALKPGAAAKNGS